MTDCNFDKGAEALKLIDWGSVTYLGATRQLVYFATRYDRRVRIKILKEKGLSYANLKITFLAYDDYEKIENLVAYTYNLDNAGNVNTTKVSKASIYKKKINEGISEMIIAFPEVKVGSVIEYAYSMQRGLSTSINDWDFQSKIPVRYSEYVVTVPSYLHFKPKPFVTDKMETREEESKTHNTINPSTDEREYTMKKSYIMQNVKGLSDEPFMGAAKDYRQRIEFLLSQVEVYGNDIVDLRTSWSNVVEDLKKSKYFGQQLEAFMPKTLNLVEQWKKITDQKTMIKTIFKHVQQVMTWNEDEGFLSYDGVEDAYRKKEGNMADINLTLLTLLKKCGVKADPILFSTRNHGLVNTMYPEPGQFNVVMAYIPIDGKYWVLDATDKLSPCTLIPSQVVNSNGFLIQGDGGKWIEILEDKIKYKVFTAIRSEIDVNGKMLGEATVNCSGYAKKGRCEKWIKDKEAFKKEYFSQENISLNVEDIIVNNVNVDSLPLEQKIKFSSALNSSGDYFYFTTNLFSGLTKNPFISEQRVSDIEYGYLQDYIIIGNYNIPDGYEFDALPENISLQMPDKSIVFNRYLNAVGNQLNVRMNLEFKNSYYPVSEYPDFREFQKKLYATLNEQVVIKKK